MIHTPSKQWDMCDNKKNTHTCTCIVSHDCGITKQYSVFFIFVRSVWMLQIRATIIQNTQLPSSHTCWSYKENSWVTYLMRGYSAESLVINNSNERKSGFPKWWKSSVDSKKYSKWKYYFFKGSNCWFALSKCSVIIFKFSLKRQSTS